MKLSEVFKSLNFPEPSTQDIQTSLESLKDGKVLNQLEGGKFALLQQDNYYALLRNHDSQIMCWAELVPYSGKISGLELKMIYVLPQFRNTIATTILVFSVKQYLNQPIIVDGPVSTQGQQLLKAITKRTKHFVVNYANATTGEKQPYQDGMLEPYDKDHIIVVEQQGQVSSNLHEYVMPGGHIHRFVLSFFEDDHDSLMK